MRTEETNMRIGEPVVSVCVITYNQERFIGRCLQSIADQKTDFPFEVIIGVDPSADGTAEIVKSFVNRYPKHFRAIFHDECIAIGCNNYRVTHSAATAKYVAHIDGDDVMLPGKLQAQAEFLEKNQDCSMVAHKLKIIDVDDQTIAGSPSVSHPEKTDLSYLLKNHTFFSHSSKMYRRVSIPERSCINNEFFIDFGLHIEMANYGEIGFLNEDFGLYRVSPSSNTKVRGGKLHRLIDLTLDAFSLAKSPFAKQQFVKRCYSAYAFSAAFFCLQQEDEEGFIKYVQMARHSTLSNPNFLIRLFSFFWFSRKAQVLVGRAMLRMRSALRIFKNFLRNFLDRAPAF